MYETYKKEVIALYI